MGERDIVEVAAPPGFMYQVRSAGSLALAAGRRAKESAPNRSIGATHKPMLLAPTPAPPQAGTLSGNPLAMVAGIKTLEILARPGAYEHLDRITGR